MEKATAAQIKAAQTDVNTFLIAVDERKSNEGKVKYLANRQHHLDHILNVLMADTSARNQSKIDKLSKDYWLLISWRKEAQRAMTLSN